MRTAGELAKALDLERTITGTRLVQMAKSGELKIATRCYNAASSLAVSADRTIVRLRTAGREA